MSRPYNKLTLAIFDIITTKNREPLLPAIAREFHNAYNVYKGIGKASITSAAPLDAKLRAELETVVKKLSNGVPQKGTDVVQEIDGE